MSDGTKVERMDLFAMDVVEDGERALKTSAAPSIVVVGADGGGVARRAEAPQEGTLGAARAARVAQLQPEAGEGDALADGLSALDAAVGDGAGPSEAGAPAGSPRSDAESGEFAEIPGLGDAAPSGQRTGVERLRVPSGQGPRTRSPRTTPGGKPGAAGAPAATVQVPAAPTVAAAQRPAAGPSAVAAARAAEQTVAAPAAEVDGGQDDLGAMAEFVADAVARRFGPRPWFAFVTQAQGAVILAAGMLFAVAALGAGWFAGSTTTHAALEQQYQKRLGSVPYLQAAAQDPVGRQWVEMLGKNSRATIEGILRCDSAYGLKRVIQSEVPGCAGGSADVNHAWRMLPGL